MDPFGPYRDASRFEIVTEGLATTVNARETDKKKAAFYNPAQVINRDLSLACIQWHVDSRLAAEPGARLTYLEALSASGLRSIRVAKETRGLASVVANDLEAAAVAQIRRNLELNGLAESGLVKASQADAVSLMHSHRAEADRFDIVDIDPYGSPTIFLDGAVQCVKDGGLLQVTATDLMNLCGGSPDVCFKKYGAVPLKSRFCHEMAIRIVLANIALRAQAYGRFIDPVMSLMIDFYVRVFVKVGTSGGETQLNATRIGHVWQCPTCHYFETQPYAYKQPNGNKFVVSSGTPVPPNCPFCNSHFKMAGPLWLGPLHQQETVPLIRALAESKGEQFASHKKLIGLLSVVEEELNDVPLFYNLSDLCNVLRSTLPSMHAFRSALIHQGFRVSGFHTEPYAFKTDAPMSVIWDILKCWKKRSGAGKQQKETTPAYKLMQVEPKVEADFTLVDEAHVSKKRPRYIKVDGWGPQKKAVTGTSVQLPSATKKAKTEEEGEKKKD